jgi:ribonuclease HI
MRCPHARVLWQALKEEWELPCVDDIVYSGSEWLLLLLDSLSITQRGRILMLFWRIWFVHNEITHEKPMPTVEGSRRFLVSYLDSLILIKHNPLYDPLKGKETLLPDMNFEKRRRPLDKTHGKLEKWKPPPATHAKLNTDGSYMANGSAGAGMVLRSSTGAAIFAASRQLFHCADAVEAELAAIDEGLNLALHWTTLPLIIETDCVEACALIKDKAPNTSIYSTRIRAIRELMKEREVTIASISRDLNCVSHLLAKFGRTEPRTAVWLGNFPPEVSLAMEHDCTSVAI